MGTKQWLSIWGFNVAAMPSKLAPANNEVAALLRRLSTAATGAGRRLRRRTDLIALAA